MSLGSASDPEPSSKVSQFSDPEVAVLTVEELETWRAAGGGAACCRYGLGRGKAWLEFRDSEDCEE